jgi:tRNA-Thr(GGU) m(6)t(6)A37 methyltransferase TsaA
MSFAKFQLTPIGEVRRSDTQTRLKIDPAFTTALEGLADFSHIIVLFWCHLSASEAHRRLLVHDKPYTQGPDRIGVLATRSPARPNPIALTTVQPLRMDLAAGVIEVPYIDAADGTPIIDLKPYHPSLDRIREVHTPGWCRHWPQWYEDAAAFDWDAEFNLDLA